MSTAEHLLDVAISSFQNLICIIKHPGASNTSSRKLQNWRWMHECVSPWLCQWAVKRWMKLMAPGGSSQDAKTLTILWDFGYQLWTQTLPWNLIINGHPPQSVKRLNFCTEDFFHLPLFPSDRLSYTSFLKFWLLLDLSKSNQWNVERTSLFGPLEGQARPKPKVDFYFCSHNLSMSFYILLSLF